MLSKPSAGWTCFKLQEKEYSLSYLTAVPFDWLKQAIHGLETMLPFTVHGFTEPGRVLCTVSFWHCYIIKSDDENYDLEPDEIHIENAHINMLEFCEALYKDISENIDDWCKWFIYFDAETDEEEDAFYADIKNQIVELLSKLQSLIDEKKECFTDRYSHF